MALIGANKIHYLNRSDEGLNLYVPYILKSFYDNFTIFYPFEIYPKILNDK